MDNDQINPTQPIDNNAPAGTPITSSQPGTPLPEAPAPKPQISTLKVILTVILIFFGLATIPVTFAATNFFMSAIDTPASSTVDLKTAIEQSGFSTEKTQTYNVKCYSRTDEDGTRYDIYAKLPSECVDAANISTRTPSKISGPLRAIVPLLAAFIIPGLVFGLPIYFINRKKR